MSTAWPNEPAGSTTLLDHNFSTILGPNMSNPYNAGSIESDPSAPYSPSSVYRSTMDYRTGGGGTELHWTYPGNLTQIYVGLWWRTNPEFTGNRVNANKTFFIRGTQGGQNGVFYLRTNPGEPKFLYWSTQLPYNLNQCFGAPDQDHCHPNFTRTTIVPGTWYRVEVYMRASSTPTTRDGEVKWWITPYGGQPVLNGSYQNFAYGPLVNQWVWSETWDGQGNGAGFTSNPSHYLDHLYISTGGTLSPSPSLPTISSFTPTSGPVGTPLSIVGTNFDPVLTGNAVSVNNVACTVLASSPTQISTAIPNTATTGRVRVTTSAGTATSSTDLTVTVPTPGGGTGGGTGGGAGATTYTFTTEFSGTQGPRWYYLNSDGSQMTYHAGSQLWQGAQLYQGIWNGGFHPGPSSAAVLKYVVPGTGTVHITGTFADLDIGGGGGVTCTIRKNGDTLTGGGPFSIANGNTAGASYDITNSVVDGDYFTFEVGSAGDNNYDSTRLNPVIVYTPQSQAVEEVTLTQTSITLQEYTSGTISLSMTPTRSTESVITFSTSGPSAVVPTSIIFPANTSSVPISVSAGPPGVATVTATLGSSSTSSTVTSTATPDPEDPVPVSPTLSAYTDFLVTYRWF